MDAVQRSAVFVRVGKRLLPESGAIARENPQTNMIDRDSERVGVVIPSRRQDPPSPNQPGDAQ